MTKKMKLALHIGTEKTGTTLLQEWLYHNRTHLSHKGYFLSNSIGRPFNRSLVSYFCKARDDFWNRNNIRSEQEKAKFFGGFLENFQLELTAAAETHHTIIVTSEHFHSRLYNPDDLAAFATFCKDSFSEIQVICYLRPQWEVRKSLYSTALKTNSTIALKDFDYPLESANPYYNYYDMYRRWGKNFGFENLNFRIYDRMIFVDGDLRRDFLKALSSTFDDSALDFSITSANESVKLLIGQAMIGVNKAVPLFSHGGVDKRNNYYKSIVNQLDVLNVGDIHDERVEEIADIFRESNAQLAREAFGRDTLFPEPESKPETEQTFTAQEVARIIEELVFLYTRRTSRRMLFDENADVLRDVALKYKTGQPVTRAEAFQLLTLAARARPNGPLIQKELSECSQED